MITRCWTNGTIAIQSGPVQISHNIRWNKPYISDTNFEYINPKNICDDVNILSLVIYFCIVLKLEHKVYNMDTHKDNDVI